VLRAATDPADNNLPAPDRSLANSQKAFAYQSTTNQNLVSLSPAALATAGGSQPHNNMMPYLTLSFCIALQGVFPPRT
jgi:microcystin-dependent protein